MLDNTLNQRSKFRTKNWVATNDESREIYNSNSQIKFRTLILMSNLYNYSGACIAVKGTITVPNTGTVAAPNNRNNEVVFKNCSLFTDDISEKNTAQIDNTKDIIIDMYNWRERSENYSQTSWSLCLYNADQQALDNSDNNIDFPANNDTSISFEYKKNINGRIRNDRTKYTEQWVPLKSSSKMCKKRYKSLCSSCNFINPGKCKTSGSIKIRL